MNLFPENQDVFTRFKLVYEELSYTDDVKSVRFSSSKQNCKIMFGDSIFREIYFREYNNEIKNDYAKFKTLPGSDSAEILHLVNPSLESSNHDSAILHFRVNELIQNARNKSDTVNPLNASVALI